MFIKIQSAEPHFCKKVFFLIENIDHWTMNGFRERAICGVKDLVESVVNQGKPYVPWKRVGELSSSAPAKENSVVISAGTTTSAQSTPPQKPRSRRHR